MCIRDRVWAFGWMLYGAGPTRLPRRGDKWPIGRTIAWVAGLALLFYTTNGPFNAYEAYLFSVHMLAHMLLTMLIPVSYTHLRAHETVLDLVCRLLLEKKHKETVR